MQYIQTDIFKVFSLADFDYHDLLLVKTQKLFFSENWRPKKNAFDIQTPLHLKFI